MGLTAGVRPVFWSLSRQYSVFWSRGASEKAKCGVFSLPGLSVTPDGHFENVHFRHPDLLLSVVFYFLQESPANIGDI